MKRAAIGQAIAILLLCWGPARAHAINVTSLADSGPGTLRDALAASNDGDSIFFNVTGQITLTSGTLRITKDVNISGPGAALLEVTRTSGTFRIFTIGNGDADHGPVVTIFGISISNGLSISNGPLPNGWGGGIYSLGGIVFIDRCLLSGNSADYAGAGIYANGGNLDVVDTTFSFNSTQKTFQTFTNNSGGGGAVFGFGSKVTLRRCTFNANTATATAAGLNGGGAIFNDMGSVTLENCTFSNNRATSGVGGTGGAIYNTTTVGGRADVAVHNCTFSENAAPSGGGIANEGASSGNSFAVLDNTILFSSSNTPGANLLNKGNGAAITSNGFNLSSDDGAGFLNNSGDQKNTDPKLGPLQVNGGFTQTMALLPGSPAQDKGRPVGVSSDQRNLPRPLDIASIPNVQGGDGSDIGAVEMDGVQTGSSFLVSTTNDHNPDGCSYADCTLREAIDAANAASGSNSISFRGGVQGTINLQAALGTLTVTDSVTILGPGARLLTVSGGDATSVLHFTTGVSTLSNLTIANGAITASGSNGASAFGGALGNDANSQLQISGCAFLSNAAHGADNTSTVSGTGGSGDGGAIGNSGSLSVQGCTFNGNLALGGLGGNGKSGIGSTIVGGTGGAARGAAVFNNTGAFLIINSSSFGNNTATGGKGGLGDGGPNGVGGNATGAVFNLGTMTITATTLSTNKGTGGAGGGSGFRAGPPGVGSGSLNNSSGSATVRDTISAGNTGSNNGGPDADGIFSSQGFNLVGAGDGSSGFTGQGDKVGSSANPIDPQLGLLQDNGGSTNTFALNVGSPAVDAGQATFAPVTLSFDQRGGPRVIDDPQVPNAGDGSDIGAFEAGASPPVLPTVTTNAATNVTTTSATVNVTINPHAYATSFNFTSDFAIFPTQQAGSGTVDLPFSANVAGLAPNTTYHFNVAATNAAGTAVGADQSFTTPPVPSPTPSPTPAATPTASPTATVGATATPTAAPTATPAATPGGGPGLVGNVSTRLPVGTDDNVLIEGFIVQGPAGSSKKIIVRAIGPSLVPFGIPDALANPTLEIHDASPATVATNDDWRSTQIGGLITGDQSAEIGSGGFAPGNDLESAIIANLAPGSYTAVVRGVNNTIGTAVVDAYDLSPGSPARLANVATRGLIQPGDKLMIGGFIIQSGSVRAVVRAIGPSLAAFGITNALTDTTLQLKDQNGTTVRENDDWMSDQKAELEATGLQPTNNLEAALVQTIAPGQYSALVRGKPEATGTGVVQVYFLQ